MTSGPEKARGVLYVVATPIGNVEDITLRARRILSEVELIACEDTRRAGRLLAALGIRKPMLSYFEHNEQRRAPKLVERLKCGIRVALVSDAGTPLISDPGFRLVRGAIDAGVAVTAVPGPSAVAAALSIAGLPSNRFIFEGFIPAKPSARARMLESIRAENRTMVFFEAARRLGTTLDHMAAAFGGARRAVVFRELTKLHEDAVRGELDDLAHKFAAEKAMGEITIVVEGASAAEADNRKAGPEITVAALADAGLGLKEASAVIARLENRGRREVYQEALRRRREP